MSEPKKPSEIPGTIEHGLAQLLEQERALPAPREPRPDPEVWINAVADADDQST
ncbi:hypothetical protein [Miniimonas sp. S16]|uniref:hypothetical protein n=1 Tax=Miniimonas sp. S16 TaxID=2171623 RepID=UPI00131F04B0|nr:hypothetical protein [Miniimonas sp. S16]